MANTVSAKKSIRKNSIRAMRNRICKSKIKTYTKKFLLALDLSDNADITDPFKKAQSEIMKGVKVGVIKLNAASRRIASLHKKLKSRSLDKRLT